MEQFFEILNIVVPSTILALFALHYNLRKKTEIRIETELAKQRIRAYESIHSAFCKLGATQTPPLKEQSQIEHIIAFYDFCDIGIDYATVFSSETDFDAFYKEVQEAIANNSILLDYDTEQQANSSLGILSEIKMCLDAFSDAERMHRINEPEPKNAQRKIDYAYQLAGILLKNDLNRSFLTMEDALSKQMSNIEVVPSHRYFKRLWRWVCERLAYVALLGSKVRYRIISVPCEHIMFFFLGRHRSLFAQQMLQFHSLLQYIDVSDRYTFHQYQNLSSTRTDSLSRDFWKRMSLQLHTMNLGMMR